MTNHKNNFLKIALCNLASEYRSFGNFNNCSSCSNVVWSSACTGKLLYVLLNAKFVLWGKEVVLSRTWRISELFFVVYNQWRKKSTKKPVCIHHGFTLWWFKVRIVMCMCIYRNVSCFVSTYRVTELKYYSWNFIEWSSSFEI